MFLPAALRACFGQSQKCGSISITEGGFGEVPIASPRADHIPLAPEVIPYSTGKVGSMR
jgi:hypothetical protein